MTTAEELVVAIRSDGVTDTKDDLQDVEKSMEDTADSAGQSADDLEGFSQKFKGAMTAAVAALVIGAAGLLAQVPVIGEAFAGLRAIVGAVVRQIDDDLRPSVSKLTDAFFEVANKVENADSTFDAIKTAISGMSEAIDRVMVSNLQEGIENLTGITVPENWLGFIVDVLTFDLPGAIEAARESIKDFPEDMAMFLEQVNPTVAKGFKKISKTIGGWIDNIETDLSDFPGSVLDGFNNLTDDLVSWAGDLAGKAREWGKDLIQRFIDGIQELLGELKSHLSDLQDIAPGVSVDIPDFGGGGGGGGGSGGGGGTTGRPGPRGGSPTGAGSAQIDGRQLSESTGRYRSDPGRRRGL